MPLNPVIFLDIDGVLNCASLFHDYRVEIYPQFSLRIRKVCDSFDANIVVSSSWRIGDDHWELSKRVLTCSGIEYKRIIDRTPTGGKARGDEIQKWLDDNGPRPYVIVDDDNDMLDSQMPYFVKTSWYEGLTEKKCNAMLQVLADQGLKAQAVNEDQYVLP